MASTTLVGPRPARLTQTRRIRIRVIAIRLVGIVAALALSLGLGLVAAGPAQAAGPKTVWDKVAQCESSGNWKIRTGNGYYGGLQFSSSTWRQFGGRTYARQANRASKAEQIAVARRVLAGQGPRAWPVCSVRAGLTKKNGKADRSATPRTNPGISAAATKSASKAVAKKKAVKKSVARPTAGAKTVKVRRGDTLGKIATRHHVKGGWKAVWKLNKKRLKNPHLIYAGQSLKIS